MSELCLHGTESQQLQTKKKKTSDLVAILQVAILNILNISRQIWVQWKLAWESDEEVVSFSVLFP